MLAACGGAAIAPAKAPPPVNVPPAAAASAARPAAAASLDGFLETPVAGEPNSVVTNPAFFGCADGPCKVGTQTCCGMGDHGICVDSVSDQWDPARMQPPQVTLCDATVNNGQYSRCDESIDCGELDVCCRHHLTSGRAKVVCMKPLSSGAMPCDYGELCLAGSPCRVAGTECRQGFCVKPVAQRRCGTEICSGDQSCCGQPPSCQPDDSCPDPVGRYDCARPGDCVDGHTCVVESSTSGCTAYVPSIVLPGVVDPFLGIPIACETASDCPADTCPHKAPARCGPGNPTWINVCLCP